MFIPREPRPLDFRVLTAVTADANARLFMAVLILFRPVHFYISYGPLAVI